MRGFGTCCLRFQNDVAVSLTATALRIVQELIARRLADVDEGAAPQVWVSDVVKGSRIRK